MKSHINLIRVGLVAIPLALSCSDFGSEPWANWRTVDLPGAQISLPEGMQLWWGLCDTSPCNPFWRGNTPAGHIDIELDYHYWSSDLGQFRQSPGYWELSTFLAGVPAIRFGCEYPSNVWSGDWHYVVGVFLSGSSRPNPLMLYARLESRGDADYAFQILCSIKAKPHASFYSELY